MTLCSYFNLWFSSRLGWRWAFFLQIPLFALSFVLTMCNLTYVTPVCLSYSVMGCSKLTTFFKGSGRSTKDILKRIDYGGSLCLLGAVSCTVTKAFFLSFCYFSSRLAPSCSSWAWGTTKATKYVTCPNRFFPCQRKSNEFWILSWIVVRILCLGDLAFLGFIRCLLYSRRKFCCCRTSPSNLVLDTKGPRTCWMQQHLRSGL